MRVKIAQNSAKSKNPNQELSDSDKPDSAKQGKSRVIIKKTTAANLQA